jgi:hypothetical protein
MLHDTRDLDVSCLCCKADLNIELPDTTIHVQFHLFHCLKCKLAKYTGFTPDSSIRDPELLICMFSTYSALLSSRIHLLSMRNLKLQIYLVIFGFFQILLCIKEN